MHVRLLQSATCWMDQPECLVMKQQCNQYLEHTARISTFQTKPPDLLADKHRWGGVLEEFSSSWYLGQRSEHTDYSHVHDFTSTSTWTMYMYVHRINGLLSTWTRHLQYCYFTIWSVIVTFCTTAIRVKETDSRCFVSYMGFWDHRIKRDTRSLKTL